MGNFNRGGRDGGRGGYRSDRPSFGGGGRSFDRGSDRGDRQMFRTICSNCGKDCEVPFNPTSGKPVYCRECFERMDDRRSVSPRPERSEYRAPTPAPAPSFDANKTQFEVLHTRLDTLNTKLERILKLLEPTKLQAIQPVATEPAKTEIPTKTKVVKKKTSSKE